jgi:hypothetical protein
LGVQADSVLNRIFVRNASILVLLKEYSEARVAIESLRREGVLKRIKSRVLGRGILIDLLSDLIETSLHALFLGLFYLLLILPFNKLFSVCEAIMVEIIGYAIRIQPWNNWLRCRVLKAGSFTQL